MTLSIQNGNQLRIISRLRYSLRQLTTALRADREKDAIFNFRTATIKRAVTYAVIVFPSDHIDRWPEKKDDESRRNRRKL